VRVNSKGQAHDLAHHCSRLSGPSRLGISESSWALGSPYLHPWPFGTYWWCCVSLSYPSLDGESGPADRPSGHLLRLMSGPTLENQRAPSGPVSAAPTGASTVSA
jgi:hypothetical protein